MCDQTGRHNHTDGAPMIFTVKNDVERASAAVERADEGRRSNMKSKHLKLGCAIVVAIVMACVCNRLSVVYEASSGFYYGLQSRLKSGETVEHGDVYVDDILNDRLQKWRSARVKDLVIKFFRDAYPNIHVPEEELRREVELSRLGFCEKGQRVFHISVCSRLPEVCAGLANAYVEAISAYTDEENKIRNDKAVAQIHAAVGHGQRAVERIRRKFAELGGSVEAATSKVELGIQLEKEMARIEELRQKEVKSRKLSEDGNMAVAFAWRAMVSKRLVFQ